MRRRLALGFVVAIFMIATVVLATGRSSSFVGAERCGKCHRAALEVWKQSFHARAFAALPDKNKQDPRCLQCHGDGNLKRGGVQCESCHGSGKHYAESYVMKDPELSRIVGLVDVTKDTCQRCHTSTTPSIRPFESEKM